MITIIFGPPRIGKTAFMVNWLNNVAYDFERNRMMQQSIRYKNENGFNLTVPQHAVSANFEIKFSKQGYRRREARIINPFRLGFANDEVKTHFTLPYETIGIMEAQKYYNSRAYKTFKDWQSRFYEQHGHNNINILMDTQRPGLIDINIRALANFVEICKLNVKENANGRFESVTWKIRIIENVGLLERYLSSGRQDRATFTESKVVSNVNVFKLYDSMNCEPKFYAGHFDDDFDLNYGFDFGGTKEDYIRFLDVYDDEKPKALKG